MWPVVERHDDAVGARKRARQPERRRCPGHDRCERVAKHAPYDSKQAMFGRKRKQEQDGLGLPSADSPGLSVPSVAPSVTVTPSGSVPPPHDRRASGATPSAVTPPAFTPGTIPVGMSGAAALAQILSGHGPVGEMIQQIKADPEGFRQRMLAQAQAAGVSTFVVTPQGMTPIGHPAAAPAPQHVDVIDELTKAADLHDKGALTDAEFDALKKKLLGE